MRVPRVHPLGQFRQELDRLFSDFARWPGFETWPRLGSVPSESFPTLNVWESPEAFHVEAELPGIRQEQLEIMTVGNELTLRGERASQAPADVSYHRRERGTGKFARVLRLPAEVDAARVEATLSDGVLQITLPKSAAAQPRKIPIRVG